MNMPPVLLIPEKLDEEFKEIISCWENRGGEVLKLGKYWIKDEILMNRPFAIYGNQTFSLILAQIYDRKLVTVDDTLIATIGKRWTKRMIELKPVNAFTEADFPAFIKPVIPKNFTAGVFNSWIDFQEITEGLPDKELTLTTAPIEITAEARAFVLNGTIQDIAIYEGAGDLASGEAFLKDFLAEQGISLSSPIVIDIAYAETAGGWMILEFNSCWGAGLNNCRAEKVIDCIIGATQHT